MLGRGKRCKGVTTFFYQHQQAKMETKMKSGSATQFVLPLNDIGSLSETFSVAALLR